MALYWTWTSHLNKKKAHTQTHTASQTHNKRNVIKGGEERAHRKKNIFEYKYRKTTIITAICRQFFLGIFNIISFGHESV